MALSKLQKKQYQEIRKLFSTADCKIINLEDSDAIRMKDVLDLLEQQGYIHALHYDNANAYRLDGNLNDFDDWCNDMAREERKLSRREWRIAIVSALIGVVGGLIPTIITFIKGACNGQ